MNSYETEYKKLVLKILEFGEERLGRNGITKAIFGETFKVNLQKGFPLLTSRQIYYKGVFGELAAMLKGPKTLEDFKKQGCNYWDLWAKPNGAINIDYGNTWLDFNGYDQLSKLVEGLQYDPRGRRHIITGWKPDNLDSLSLPCCHYAYQWYVREDRYLDMMWHQRSVDTMVGLPSDVVFAAAWLIILANNTGYIPGIITFTLGDTHIYSEHLDKAEEYLARLIYPELPGWKLKAPEYADHTQFTSDWLEIKDYSHMPSMKFELKA